MGHHNRVIKLACTCASLTPAPRFQGSSSLCPSPFNCITRNIKTHLPYSTFFSLHLSLYLSQSTFSHTPSLCFNPFSLLLSIFSLFTLSLLSLSIATLVHSSFLSSLTLLFFFLLFFYFCISCTGISFICPCSEVCERGCQHYFPLAPCVTALSFLCYRINC